MKDIMKNICMGGGKIKPPTSIFLGQNVGAFLETMHEALWKECISASNVLRYQGIGKSLCW